MRVPPPRQMDRAWVPNDHPGDWMGSESDPCRFDRRADRAKARPALYSIFGNLVVGLSGISKRMVVRPVHKTGGLPSGALGEPRASSIGPAD